MYSEGDFSLYGYLPFMLVGFYPLFKERGAERVKVDREKGEWEVRGLPLIVEGIKPYLPWMNSNSRSKEPTKRSTSPYRNHSEVQL
jgi:hypothetical protein